MKIIAIILIFLWFSGYALASHYEGDDAIDWTTVIAAANGTTCNATSEAEFNTCITNAGPGDVIRIEDGTYSGWALDISSSGTASQPIIYTARNPGSVTFQNGVKFLWITGDYNVIGGFIINNVDDDVFRFHSQASYNRLTDNNITSPGSTDVGRGYVNVREQSHYNRFDHNVVTGAGDAIRIWLHEDAIANGPSQYTRIDHNTFQDALVGPQGRSVLQIGQGIGLPASLELEVHAIFEHNVIENHSTGYDEIVSSKSCYNIVRDNEINNSYGGISLRSGNYTEVYRNYIHGPRGGHGIRISGAYHKVYNNVIDAPDKKHGIFMSRWGHRVGTSSLPSTHNNLIAHNTIIDYDQYGMRIGDYTGIPNGACRPVYDCNITNNIIIGDVGTLIHYNTSAYVSGNANCAEADWPLLGDGLNDVTFRNDLYHATGTASNGSAYALDTNKITGNPSLVSIFHLPSGSIAIDVGIAVSGITDDYYGTLRSLGAAPDIGAYEYDVVISNASPAQGSTGISTTTDLNWTNPTGTTNIDLLFDKKSEHDPPTTVELNDQNVETWDCGTLDYSTEYAWRVDVNHAGGTETGTVYYFTTTAKSNPPIPSVGMNYCPNGVAGSYCSKGIKVQQIN